MNKHREGTAYIQVAPGKYPSDLRVVKATQRKPTVTDPNAVVVKVRLRIPAAAFEPLQPEAVVTVPESLIQHPVDVQAEEPE